MNNELTQLESQSSPSDRKDWRFTHRLRAIARRLRVFVLLQGALRLAALGLLFTAVSLGLDYGLRLDRPMRLSILLLSGVGAAYVTYRWIIAPMFLSIPTTDIAKLVERKVPTLGSLLISAVRFSEGELGAPRSNSPALAASVMRYAEEACAAVDFESVLKPRRARTDAAGLIVVLAVMAFASWFAPRLMSLWFARNVLMSNEPWWQRTTLIIEGAEGVRVAALGQDVEVRGRAEGVNPSRCEITYQTASGRRGRETMTRVGEAGFRFTLVKPQEDFTYQLRGGDAVTEPYTVHMAPPPTISDADISIVPPAYTNQSLFTVPKGQRFAQVVPGSDVTIRAQTNKPIVRATLRAGGSGENAIEAEVSGATCTVTLRASESNSFFFDLADEFELRDPAPPRFAIRVIPDDPPSVRLQLLGVGDMITLDAVLPIQLQVTDAFGLASVELTARAIRDEPTDAVPIALASFQPDQKNLETTVDWPAASSAAIPGERIELVAEAADRNDVSGPGITRAAPIQVRVVSPDELLAELNRREQELRAEFERLIDSQETLRADLLTAFAELGRVKESPDAAKPPESAASTGPRRGTDAWGGFERRQRTLASSIHMIGKQFEQILGEMTINRIAEDAEKQRIHEGIVVPLTDLSRRDLAAASDRIREIAREPRPDAGAGLDEMQQRIISDMRSVLSNMLQWEGFQEAVTMLREIVRLQKQLADEVKKEASAETEGIFDD